MSCKHERCDLKRVTLPEFPDVNAILWAPLRPIDHLVQHRVQWHWFCVDCGMYVGIESREDRTRVS